jgi:hypothetical protein
METDDMNRGFGTNLPQQDSYKRNYDTRAAARYLDVSESYLNKLRCNGGGPEFLKIGTLVKYQIASLDRWLSGHRRKSTSDDGAGR